MNRNIARAAWWWAYPVALLLVVLTDVALGFWRPFPPRLPEQFSHRYLELYVSDVPKNEPVIMLFGDSVLWGYKLSPSETAAAILQRDLPGKVVANFSYEGGSPPNTLVMLRYLLQVGVRPAAAVIDLNSKEFSALDSAYRTLHPSLESAAYSVLTNEDWRALELHTAQTPNAKIDRYMERVWRFYGLRADLRERLFGTDDLAGSLLKRLQDITGTTAGKAIARRRTRDRFLGTYDLAPIAPNNIAWQYYTELIRELCAAHVPAVIFLTPTNHGLLHAYIDVPEYDANLRHLMAVPHCASISMLNLDRAVPDRMFIDNDHLTGAGQRVLAKRLRPSLEKLLQ